jgi:hypothetical protein
MKKVIDIEFKFEKKLYIIFYKSWYTRQSVDIKTENNENNFFPDFEKH